MTFSRRDFLATAIAAAALARGGRSVAGAALGSVPLINRKALVDRHSPTLKKLDPLAPLSLGNGEFAFTADVTGLQTFPREYEQSMPLCTMSQWGWHTKPLPAGVDPKQFRLTQYDTHGRPVGYATGSDGQRELFDWLRENPHRLHLGQIGLLMLRGDEAAVANDLSEVRQQLDLWTGTLHSRFKVSGSEVYVQTAAHPDLDLLAVSIESRMIREGRLALRLGFPYGSPEMKAADWNHPRQHESKLTSQLQRGVRIHRKLDADEYHVAVEWAGDASFQSDEAHQFILTPDRSSEKLTFVVAFSPQPFRPALPSAAATLVRAGEHWRKFWNSGGAVDLSGSSDSRAAELERRVVLSQYLTAIQCSGSAPPQETGLTVNSWYGKFHLEMHWWHAAHFALWNRAPLLERSLDWYGRILPGARERARSQGYRGARWPKMVGPEGRDSPSPIGPLLIWQQPHPIFYAELCYRAHPNRRTLARYREIVFASAEFMASFAYFENAKQRYVLGPPVIPAQENHPPRETWNPTFELAYWKYGLRTAQRWRERLGLGRERGWDQVIEALSALPVRDGVYLAHENCPQTFTERNHDHPSMLGALGVLPGDMVDRETMRRTLAKVMKDWQWDKTWGWDYPMTAMTAARLGETNTAIDALLMTTEKNRYLPNGHNWQRPNLPCYLPGNGGLLYAIALMAGGWSGAPPRSTPGFPSGGSWQVQAENLNTQILRTL
jgi:hypothetical protein